VEWKQAPLQVEVTSAGLDLAFLSGITDQVPRVEGQLDAKATVNGTLGLPGFVGSAEWKRGRVAVMGYGEYREIELKLQGSDAAFTLERLFAKAGGGQAELTGVAQKRPEGWRVRLSGDAKDFPIVTDDQLKASLSVDGVQADGLFTADLIDVQRLYVPRAVIELPEVRGRTCRISRSPRASCWCAMACR